MSRPTSSLAALRRLLDRSQRPIYALDGTRTIVYANAAMGQWCGVEPGELIGERCHYHAPGEGPGARAAGLCPPPQALLEEEHRMVATFFAEGRLRRRQAAVAAWQIHSQLEGAVVVLDERDLDEDPRPSDEEPAELHQLVARLRTALASYATYELMGDSAAMQRVRQQVGAAVQSDVSVLAVGPVGSGRENVLRSIHYSGSPDGAAGLLPLSCSLLDAELLANTLEDLRQSAADWDAEPAALLLLDVDELASDTQRALMESLDRLERPVRLLATARRPLLELAEQGYRADLAHRLSSLVIELPSLQSRPADVPLLAQMALEDHNAQGGQQLGGFTPEALDQLALYPWFGNVQELHQLVSQACRRATPPLVQVADLPGQIRSATQQAAHPRRQAETIDLEQYLENIERELIDRAMRQAKGNKAQAARLLGLNRAKLLRRLEHLGLNDKPS